MTKSIILDNFVELTVEEYTELNGGFDPWTFIVGTGALYWGGYAIGAIAHEGYNQLKRII